MTHDDLVRELRELRERHSETLVEETDDGRLERCNLCSEWWPCDAIRSADEIERLRTALSRANENLERAWKAGWDSRGFYEWGGPPESDSGSGFYMMQRDIAALRKEKR